MSTARLLTDAVALARSSGFFVREDNLDGAGGGHCFVQGGRWLLLDVTQTLEEQLDDTLDALADLPNLPDGMSPELLARLQARTTAGTPSLSGSTLGHAA